MKKITIALAALGLAAGAAQADSFRDQIDRERRDAGPVSVRAEHTVQIPAGKIYSTADLANTRVKPTDLLTVTSIPSSGKIDVN